MKRFALMVLGGAALIWCVPNAQAVTYTNGTLTVVEGSPTPSETHVYFDLGTDVTSGTGHVGGQTDPRLLTFTTDATVTFSSGFAHFDSISGGAHIFSLDITSPTGLTWNDMVFGAAGPSGSAATQLSIEALLNGVSLGKVNIADIGSGNESFLTFIISAGLMNELKITSAATSTGIDQFKQFEISLTAVPLPPAALLFGTALVGMGILGRRRRSVG